MLIFLVATLVSFVGSLQVGPVNMAVMQATLRKDIRHAYYVAIGGALPELLYSTIAVVGIASIENWQYFQILSDYLPPTILIGIGIYFLLKKHPNLDPSKSPSGGASLLNGLTIGLLNPQLLTFWAAVVLYFKGIDGLYQGGMADDIAVIMGSAVGAMLLFMLLIRVAHRNKAYLRLYTRRYRIEVIIGVLLISLGVGKFLFMLV